MSNIEEQEQLIKRLNDLNEERNKVIQLLRKTGKSHLGKPVFNMKQIFNNEASKFIGKCGILKEKGGTTVFIINEVSLLPTNQMGFYCKYIFIHTNSSQISISSYTKSNSILFKSKVFNENTGKFDCAALNNVRWIEEWEYNILVKKDPEVESLREKLNNIRDLLLKTVAKHAQIINEQVEKIYSN